MKTKKKTHFLITAGRVDRWGIGAQGKTTTLAAARKKVKTLEAKAKEEAEIYGGHAPKYHVVKVTEFV